MDIPRLHGAQAVRRTLVTAAVTLAGLLALAVPMAQAAPGTQVYTGQAGGSSPDIQQGSLVLFDQGGGAIPSGGIAGTLNFTLDGTPFVGYCIDTSRIFSEGSEPVDATVQDPPTTATNRALAWILVNQAPSGTPTPEKAAQAAAAQVATWLLVDAQINKTTPTSSATVNAAAAALVQEALAATAAPATLTASIAAPAAGATSATVTVTGRPGATVALSIASGTGSLSASSVVIGAGGTGTATLTSAQPGTVVVNASTAGDGRLVLINPTDPERNAQPTAVATPTVLTASAQVVFQAAPVVTVTPPAPTPVVTRTPAARLTITKVAPARSFVLREIRYRITVKNTSTTIARNVTLRDPVPGGLSYVRSSRTSALRSGVVTFSLGTLQPGESASVDVVMLANASVRGSRTNTATVSAINVKPVSASASTRFRVPVRRVQPAVTG